jgi:AcrR family transcriptional regulator
MAARKRPEDRRDEILRGALSVIGRRGFAEVTTRDVATEIGVTHGLLHHYFPSRGGLIAAAFDLFAVEQLADMHADLAPFADDPVTKLAVIAAPPDQACYLLWIDAWSEAPRNVDLREILRRHQSSWEKLTSDVIRQGVKAGAFAADTDAKRAAKSIIAFLDGLAVQVVAMDLIGIAEHRKLAFAHVEGEVGLAPGTLKLPKARTRPASA